MEPIKRDTWSMVFDERYATATLTVSGFPNKEEAQEIGEAFVAFAKSLGGRKWAILSDLREMKVATPEGRDQWIQNMIILMNLGLGRWAVVNSAAMPAMQARNVAVSSNLEDMTLLTESEKAAVEWCRGVVDL